MSVVTSITTDGEDIDNWLNRYRNKSEKQIEEKVEQVRTVLLNADPAEVIRQWRNFQGDKRLYKNPKRFEDFVESVKERFGVLANKVRSRTTTDSEELEIDSLRLILVKLPQAQAQAQASTDPKPGSQDTKHDEDFHVPSKSEKEEPSVIIGAKVEPGVETDELAKNVKPRRRDLRTDHQVQSKDQDVKHQALLYFAQKDADAMYRNPDLPTEMLTAANARFHQMSVDSMLARDSDSDSDSDSDNDVDIGRIARANQVTEQFVRLGLKDINRSVRAHLRERR